MSQLVPQTVMRWAARSVQRPARATASLEVLLPFLRLLLTLFLVRLQTSLRANRAQPFGQLVRIAP
jgi:hypothetical protein